MSRLLSISSQVRKRAAIDAAWEQHRQLRAPSRTAALRRRLSAGQNNRCCSCGALTLEASGLPNSAIVERVLPRSCCGPGAYDSLVMSCLRCKDDRGSRTDFLSRLLSCAMRLAEGGQAELRASRAT